MSVQPGSALAPGWPPWRVRLLPTRKDCSEPPPTRSAQATLGSGWDRTRAHGGGSSCLRGRGFMPKAMLSRSPGGSTTLEVSGQRLGLSQVDTGSTLDLGGL